MVGERENTNVFHEYFGISGRSIVLFLSFTIGTVAVVTCIYMAIFGVDTWRNSMQQAGSLMFSGYTPQTQPPAAVGAAPAAVNSTPQNNSGCQFLCPSCGMINSPLWSANGDPMCPNCGALLGLSGSSGNAARQAA